MAELPKPPPEDPTRRARKFAKRLRRALESPELPDEAREDLLGFTAFAVPWANHSKAQLFQDLWALWASGQKTGGYFVEFGAADGVDLSNSFLLEKEFGWSGLLAEPNPEFFASLAANRGCAISRLCVHPVADGPARFLAAQEGVLSRLEAISPDDMHEEGRLAGASWLTVDTITLNDLLFRHEAPAVIDYMSVDTEGSELPILSSFDFDRWDVRAISVEHNHTPARSALHDLLAGVGYRRQLPEVSFFDDWYVKV